MKVNFEEAIDVVVTKKVNDLKINNEKIIKQHNLVLDNISSLLDLVEHSRTSCSDENPCNANDFDHRCTRCQLLRIQQYNWNDKWVVNITLDSEEVVVIDENKIRQEIKNL